MGQFQYWKIETVNEGLGTKLVLRCNNRRRSYKYKKVIPDQYTQYTWYESVRKKEKRSAKTICNIKSRQTYNPYNLDEK